MCACATLRDCNSTSATWKGAGNLPSIWDTHWGDAQFHPLIARRTNDRIPDRKPSADFHVTNFCNLVSFRLSLSSSVIKPYFDGPRIVNCHRMHPFYYRNIIFLFTVDIYGWLALRRALLYIVFVFDVLVDVFGLASIDKPLNLICLVVRSVTPIRSIGAELAVLCLSHFPLLFFGFFLLYYQSQTGFWRHLTRSLFFPSSFALCVETVTDFF